MARASTLPTPLARLSHAGWPRGFEVVQFPNPPLILALVADIGARVTNGQAHRVALAIFYLALTVWAYREAVEGSNWFRRALGVGFLIFIAAQLSSKLHG